MKPREIVVVSGKGGSGKTSLVAAFAGLGGLKALADCDVDAADLHLILSPCVRYAEEFTGGGRAVIRQEACVKCGECMAKCRFDAICSGHDQSGQATFAVDPLSCEGCAVCVRVCPVDAVDFEPSVSGEWYISDTRHGPMVHARLRIAEENSGKLVAKVRQQAAKVAEERRLGLVLVDGPPGIGCPVIASLSGADLALAVTEPTVSGLHDLNRVVDLASHFDVPVKVCVNKCDINREMTRKIREVCESRRLEVIAELPYDPDVTRAQIEVKSIVEYSNGPVSTGIRKMWEEIEATPEVTLNE